MAITPEQKAKLEATAQSMDVSVDVLIEIAEDELSKRKPEDEQPDDAQGKPKPDDAKPAGEIKVFQYHLPFMTVAEVRKTIGLAPDGVPDASMVTGAWIAKHGGSAPNDSPTPGATGARTDDGSANTGRGE